MGGSAPDGYQICGTCRTAIRQERQICPSCGSDPTVESGPESIDEHVEALTKSPSLQPLRFISLGLGAVGLVCGLLTPAWWGVLMGAAVIGFLAVPNISPPHPGYYDGTIEVTSGGFSHITLTLASAGIFFGVAMPLLALTGGANSILAIIAVALVGLGLLAGAIRIYRIYAHSQGFESRGVPT